MKRVLVIGGGIVGITAAYFSKRSDTNVVLVEASDQLGGLHRSCWTQYGSFDFGTHVAGKTGINELDQFLFSDFTKKNCFEFNLGRSGNFFNGRLSDISPHVNTNFVDRPTYEKGCTELINATNQVGENLKETLINRYGKTFYKTIFERLIERNFDCDASELANECLGFFDMNRVLAFDKENSEIRKKDLMMDQKLGFHSATAGVDKKYPKTGGIGTWVKYLERKIRDANINIRTQSQVTSIKIDRGKYFVTIGKESFETDQLIWTLSSGLLNRFIPTNTAGSKPRFRKTAIYDFVFDRPLNTKSQYINVYEPSLLSTRITCYQNLQNDGEFFACSVEVLQGEKTDSQKNIEQVRVELLRMGIVEKDSKCRFSQCRVLKEGFPVLTVADVERLRSINRFYEEKHPNIILVGRSSASGFFTSELLRTVYKKLVEQ